MREANLYRGKREDTNAWVKGYHVVIGSIDMIVSTDGQFHKIIPETVGQCTGLHTVTEQRIWEGDIVQRNGTKYVVQRECDTPGGYWAETGYILKEIGVCDYISFVDTIDEYCNEICVQIIGNIHDDYDRPGGAQ